MCWRTQYTLAPASATSVKRHTPMNARTIQIHVFAFGIAWLMLTDQASGPRHQASVDRSGGSTDACRLFPCVGRLHQPCGFLGANGIVLCLANRFRLLVFGHGRRALAGEIVDP